MSHFRAICFDLDDTLRDPSGAGDALRRACAGIGELTGLDPAMLLARNAEVWPALWREVEEPWTLGGTSGAAVTTEAWRRTLEACGQADAAMARRAADIHLAELFGAQRLFDDARALLDAIDADLRLAVITNGASDTQRAVLRALGIHDRLDAVIVSGEVGVAKPDVRIFRLALDALGMGPRDCWHVGDNLLVDVMGAQAAGLTAVWLNRSGEAKRSASVTPDLEVRSLLDLRPHLARGRRNVLGPRR
jgi:putative hydrolase of the HAD superfamily